MSVLDLLKKEKKTPVFYHYSEKIAYQKAQEKKAKLERERKASHVINPAPSIRPCPICELPMSIPFGTIINSHKACRPRFKRAVRRLAKKQ